MTYTEASSENEEYQDSFTPTNTDVIIRKSDEDIETFITQDLPLDPDSYGFKEEPSEGHSLQEDTSASSISSSTYSTSRVRKTTYRLVRKK